MPLLRRNMPSAPTLLCPYFVPFKSREFSPTHCIWCRLWGDFIGKKLYQMLWREKTTFLPCSLDCLMISLVI